MRALLLNIWDDFSNWVTHGWTDLTYILVVGAFGLIALVSLLGFLKGPKFNKDVKPFKWGSVVLCILSLLIIGVISLARYM